MTKKKAIERRQFLKGSAAGVATLVLAPGTPADPGDAPAVIKKLGPSDTVSLGYIGVGVRGQQLMSYSGFPHPRELRSRSRRRNRRAGRETENLPRPLNVRCAAVSDCYKGRQQWGRLAGGRGTKVYARFEEMLEDKSIDAVVIATSDHNHARIGIMAAQAGKHVYSEKCFAHTIDQAKAFRDAVKKAGIVYQLGHQTRSGSLMTRARDALKGVGHEGTIGKVTLIETYTQRNDANGAWFYKIERDAGPDTIDWEAFLGDAPKREFNASRFFRWRKYWDYGTGLAGDLLTHEMDAVQNVTGLGIPDTATASGGIYYWPSARNDDDDRETPDVLQVTLNYEKAGLLATYNATLANSWRREQMYFGHDGTMDMSQGTVKLYVDGDSDRYGDLIEKGEWMLPTGDERDRKAMEEIRAATGDTSKWTVDKGIYVDVVNGREVNVTALHVLDWVEHIRAGETDTNCHVDLAFEEAVTSHMANVAYHRGRRMRWDREREELVNDG